MYQERRAWPASAASARGVGRRTRARIQWPAWSREGPPIDVNESTRPHSRGVVTASQPAIEPQSWPTRCTARPGTTASSTATQSSTRSSRS